MLKDAEIGVAIIGGGYGFRVILPCFQAAFGMKPVALACRNPEKAQNEARAHGVRLVSEWKSLLEMEEVDLICVATPPSLHLSMSRGVLEAGKHLLCEKPMVMNLEEAEELENSAQKSSSKAIVDHQLRFHPNLKKIRECIQEGLLGNVHYAQISYETAVRLSEETPWDWWSDGAQGGGELNALGSHFVDLLQWWLGEVDWVQGNLKTCFPYRIFSGTKEKRAVTADEIVMMHLQFKNGVAASLVLSCVSPSRDSLEIKISGTEGTLSLRGFDTLVFIKRSGEVVDLSQKDPLISKPVIGLNSWRTSLVRLGEHFARCLLKGEPMEGAALIEDGRRTQAVLDAARRSHQLGRCVRIKEMRLSRDCLEQQNAIRSS